MYPVQPDTVHTRSVRIIAWYHFLWAFLILILVSSVLTWLLNIGVFYLEVATLNSGPMAYQKQHLLFDTFYVSMLVFGWISPLALAGGYWFVLLNLGTERIRSVWLKLLGMHALFLSLTLCALNAVTFAELHLHLLQNTADFGEPAAPIIPRLFLQIPEIIPFLLLLVILYGGISLGPALLLCPWEAVRHLTLPRPAKHPFLLVYGVCSCLIFAVYILFPYFLQGLYVAHLMPAGPLGREIIYEAATLVFPPAAVALFATIKTSRFLVRHIQPRQYIEELSDDALSLSTEPIAHE